jgi:molybdate transport system substrate-binding protein
MKKLHVLFVAAFALALVAAFALVGCGGSSASSASSEAASSEAASAEAASSEAASAEAASSEAASSEAAPTEGVQLQVFAANSLQKALPEVEALYTAKTGVTFVESETGYAASGTLVETLTADPTAADILITASAGSMDDAEAGSLVDPATRQTMFTNDLVLAVASDSDLQITDVKDLATDAIASFAMGEPNAVPAGNYALQTLVSAGLATGDKAGYEFDASIADKVNDGADKVGTVATYISSKEVDCGFVYTSDIYRYDGIKVAYTVPADMHKDIVYPGAVCAQSANADVAADFLNFCMTDADAQAVFAQYGFELA